MGYRYEFEEPDDSGQRRVRAYRGDDCVMSGIFRQRHSTVTDASMYKWCPCHESKRQVFDRYDQSRIDDGQMAIDALVEAVSKSYVFVFVDDCPWVIEGVPGYETQAEADAFVDGFHYAGEDSTAKRWPFTADDLAKTMHNVDADALMVDVLARVAAMGIVTL